MFFKNRYFALVALLLLTVEIHSANSVQLDLSNDVYSDLDENIISDLNLDVNDLAIKSSEPPRSDSYNKILNYVQQIQKQVNDEHASLTKIFNAQKSEQVNQKNRLSEAEKALDTLSKNIRDANWQYGNLTEAQRTREIERARVLKSIETQRAFIKQELDLVQSMSQEATKVRNYEQHQLIVREINDLKSAIVKETDELMSRYNALISNIETQSASGKKTLLQSEQKARDLNITYSTMLKNYQKLQADYNSFMVEYTKNVDRNSKSEIEYKKEILLLQAVYDMMSKIDPQQCLETKNNYSDLQKKYDDLNKQCTSTKK